MFRNWKYTLASICIPLNIIFVIVGIVINDMNAVMMAVSSIGLLLLPIFYDHYAKEEEDN